MGLEPMTMSHQYHSQRRQGLSASKPLLKAATICPFVGLARSKGDPINHMHSAQYLLRTVPAGAEHMLEYNLLDHGRGNHHGSKSRGN